MQKREMSATSGISSGCLRSFTSCSAQRFGQKALGRRCIALGRKKEVDRCSIGVKAYTEAGGLIDRDLFQPEHEGYLTDAALLDRLTAEKCRLSGKG
jgi:hypothetical protein